MGWGCEESEGDREERRFLKRKGEEQTEGSLGI